MLKLNPILEIMRREFIMFSFLQKKSEPEYTKINKLYNGLKKLYSGEVSVDRKK